MIVDFADLLEVDFSQENARFLGFTRLKVRLHLGKDLPDLWYISYARDVYLIRFARVWDICSSPSSSWGTQPDHFIMGSFSVRGSHKPYRRFHKGNQDRKVGHIGRGINYGNNVWTRSTYGYGR